MASDELKIDGDGQPVSAKQLKEAVMRVNGQSYKLNDLIVDTLTDLLQRVEKLEARPPQQVVHKVKA